MTLRRICIPFFFFTAESAMPLLSRKKIPFSCPDSTLWVAQQGPGLRLSGCSESKQLFAYPEGQRRIRNHVWRLLSSPDDLWLFDIELHIMTLAACRWCIYTSDIGNHFRFVCLREEEVGELLSCEERRYGQGRCFHKSNTPRQEWLLEGQSDDSTRESLSCVESRISTCGRMYQLHRPPFVLQRHLSSRCEHTRWCRRRCGSLTPASSPLPREPNARRESNSSCASLHREKQGEVWPRHSIGHPRFDGGLAALPASSSQPDPAKLTEVDLEDIVSFITCDSRDPSPSDAGKGCAVA